MADDWKGDLRREAEEKFDLSTLDEIKLYFALGVIRRKVGPVVKTWLVNLWTDPAYFTGACRFVAISLTGAILTGNIKLPEPYEGWMWQLAPWIAALAAGVPAGQTNRAPGEIKQIANDPTVLETPVPKP